MKRAVGLDRNNPEVFENTIASLIDMTSILFAYQIGLSGSGIWVGVLYAMFDAFIVIWMRKPISRFAKSISPFRLQRKAQPLQEDRGLRTPGDGGLPAADGAGSGPDGPVAQGS